MAANEVRELLETAAPAPKAPLDIGQIERRAYRRRRRRHMMAGAASLLVIGLLIGLAVEIPDSRGRDTVVAGPGASRKIPVEFHEAAHRPSRISRFRRRCGPRRPPSRGAVRLVDACGLRALADARRH
jgi:hypothetical protein